MRTVQTTPSAPVLRDGRPEPAESTAGTERPVSGAPSQVPTHDRPINQEMGQHWFRSSAARRARTALAALAAAGALGAPAASHAAVPSDAYPTPQAIAANAEFLLQAPPPPSGGTICIIDTGVTPLPDTASRITDRIAIDGGNPDDVYHDPADPFSGHGTFVAGTIASQVDGYGSAGIWPAAKIVSVRVFRQPGRGRLRRRLPSRNRSSAATRRLRSQSSMSRSARPQRPKRSSIAWRTGSSAPGATASTSSRPLGTTGALNEVSYPARFPSSFAVGATDGSGAFCGFSNRGAGLDLSSSWLRPRA